ncbi:hypothetical protein COCON_G00150330 [Conger conger]|uniref:Ig-like domain-containing protein n=1 Tax=Conger conger TaxID=82655 RepID=A0A9Q1DDD8_CONCO|nr:hypothetical protein COCON_G00150330 [Conger conger]
MSCVSMLLLLSGHIFLVFMESVVGGPLGPNITLSPRRELTQGENFNITCHIQHPGETVVLEFNDSSINGSSHHSQNDSITFMFQAGPSNSGKYSCVYQTTGPSGNYNISKSEVVIVNVKVESVLVLIVAALAGGAVFLLLLILLCVCLARKSKAHTEAAVLTYQSQPVDREDLDSEPDYMEPSEGSSSASYVNIETHDLREGCKDLDTQLEWNKAIYVDTGTPEEEESEDEEDYVNTETVWKCSAPAGDSDSEPDYENSACLSGTAK